MSLRDRFVRNLGIAALVGASTLGLGSPARAQTAFESAGSAPASATAQASAQSTAQTFTYYLPVLANLRGANNSDWRSLVRMRAISGVETHVWIQAHPRGAQAQATDPKSTMYVICGTCSANFPNLLDNLLDQGGQPMHLTGAYWGEVTSNEPLGIDSSTSANFSPDGSNQGGDYATLDASTMWNDPHLARRGDIIEFPLDGTSRTRENLNLFAPPTNTTDYTGPAITVQATLLDYLGNTIDGTTITLQPGTYTQFAPIAPALTNGKTLNAGDVLQLRLGGDGGNGEFLLYAIKNEIDNVTTTSQDPSNKTGYIRPLVTSAEYRDLPQTVEQNDIFATRVAITSRPGTTIDTVLLDTSGSGTWDNNFTGNNTNQYVLETSGAALATGTWTPKMRALITDNRVTYARDFTANTFTVNPEHNGYIATYDNAKNFIMNNLDLVSAWTSHGVVGGQATLPSTWKSAWPLYFDGINNPPNNPELDYIIFNDVGDTLTGNDMILKLKDGTQLGIGGMPEQEFDQFRRAVKATLPPS